MHLKIWQWGDAPPEYEALSGHGGDEDYVMFVPKDMDGIWIVSSLGQDGSPLGGCSVSRHELPSGDVVYIGAHA